MKYSFITLTILFTALIAISSAQARPVSYPGGWTAMLMNDGDANSSHIHYSPTAKYSVGWKHEYFRDPSVHADTAQLNYLLKRWNKQSEQANLYFKSGVGVAYKSNEFEPAAFAGLAADWETRRYFIGYENRFFYADELQSFAKHQARIGIAPYIGDYGDLHTWLMLQADYDAGEEHKFTLTPLVRLFKGSSLVEGGYNIKDETILFNFVQRF